MKTTKLIGMLAVLAMTSVATAAEEGFKISGDFAASYFGEPGKGANGGVGTGPGNGAANDTVSVDLTELNISKTLGNSGINIGVGFGTLFTGIDSAIDTVGGSIKPTLNVTSTYFWHKFGDTGVSVKLGKMTTGIGYESYNYMDNMNYTRSYGWGWQPTFMTGLNVAYTHSMFDVGLTMGNSIQNTDFDENGNKMILISAGVRPMDGLTVNANYLTGTDLGGSLGGFATAMDYTLTNAVVTYKWTQFNFALDYTMVNHDPQNTAALKYKDSSIAAYAGYGMDNWGVGLRYEMAKHDADATNAKADHDTNMGNYLIPAELAKPGFGKLASMMKDEDISAITLTGYYDLDQNARLKAEVGMQSGEDHSFVDKDGKDDSKITFYGVAAMYRF